MEGQLIKYLAITLKWTRFSKTKQSESFGAVNRLNSKEKDTYQNMKHGILEQKWDIHSRSRVSEKI